MFFLYVCTSCTKLMINVQVVISGPRDDGVDNDVVAWLTHNANSVHFVFATTQNTK